jgi:hypothetical protein
MLERVGSELVRRAADRAKRREERLKDPRIPPTLTLPATPISKWCVCVSKRQSKIWHSCSVRTVTFAPLRCETGKCL